MSLRAQDFCFERSEFRLGPLTFEFPEHARTVLLGPSASGKTTLLRAIAGLEDVRGELWLGDRLLSALPAAERKVGFVFQNLALWPHMRVVDQIRFAGRCSREAANAWLSRVGLPDRGKRLPGELSGGEGQRVALARALAQQPELLLLDEPLRSVDRQLRRDLQQTIRELCDELTLTTVIVTHDREEALALGEELVLMNAGRIIESGPPNQLLTHPEHAFTAAFLETEE